MDTSLSIWTVGRVSFSPLPSFFQRRPYLCRDEEKNTVNKTTNLCSPFVKVTMGDAISSEMGFSLSSKLPYTLAISCTSHFSISFSSPPLLKLRTAAGIIAKHGLEIANQVSSACWQNMLAGPFHFHVSYPPHLSTGPKLEP